MPDSVSGILSSNPYFAARGLHSPSGSKSLLVMCAHGQVCPGSSQWGKYHLEKQATGDVSSRPRATALPRSMYIVHGRYGAKHRSRSRFDVCRPDIEPMAPGLSRRQRLAAFWSAVAALPCQCRQNMSFAVARLGHGVGRDTMHAAVLHSCCY